jgi:hypothetical protein
LRCIKCGPRRHAKLNTFQLFHLITEIFYERRISNDKQGESGFLHSSNGVRWIYTMLIENAVDAKR